MLKNRIVVDINALNILSCKLRDAFMHTLQNDIDLTIVTKKMVAISML